MPVTDKITSAIPTGLCGTNRGARQFLFLLAMLLSAIAVSLLVLKMAPAPFFWVWLTWATTFWAAISVVSGSWPRAILFNLGIVACMLAAIEAYCTSKYVPPTVSDGFVVQDDVLGWAPAKGMKGHSIEVGPAGLLHHPTGVIFDTEYTIDSNGLRIAPPYRGEDLVDTVLFFGCSFTFGEGLKDNETLPYQVGALSGGRYRIFNFAFKGYSPAQMLAAIESGMVRRAVDTTPRYAYYVALPDHVGRVAGKVAWIKREPRYVLDPDETVRRAGFFEDHRPVSQQLGIHRGLRQLSKSATWRTLDLRESNITDDDLRLYFAIVRRSQELLKAQYPGIHFRVILYPEYDGSEGTTYEKLREGFGKMDIPLDLIKDILPCYESNSVQFMLSPNDTHPNALADRLIAQYVLNRLPG